MIFGVMMVRNEADIVRVNLLHHLASGVDHVLVVDNGSSDGTPVILEELAATTGRVHVFSRPGAFHQAATTTEFAREAYLRGARWVLPIDADEFWHAPSGSLRDVLEDSGHDVGALEVEIINFVQRREQALFDPRALLTMTRRVGEPVGSSGDASELVESGRISFVGCRYPPKHVSRGTVALQIAQGNHAVHGTAGPVRKTSALVCLHAPLRARAALTVQKAEQGRRVDEVNQYLRQAWHVRRWRRLAEQGGMDAEWAANSYLDDCLDVNGSKQPLVVDTTLRDVVAPWIESPPDRQLPRRTHEPDGTPAPTGTEALDPRTITAILERIDAVEGWLRQEEAELLIGLTRRALIELGIPAVVEIGSFCGKSTIALAEAARTSAGRVYAIDPHQGEVGASDTREGVRTVFPTFERFQRNISEAGVGELIEPIRRRSYEVAWRSPIAMLFIDGLHDYASVARDFFHFESWLPVGAYVAFHDCDDNYPGVRAFAAGLAGSRWYQEAGRAASLVVFRKVATPIELGGPDAGPLGLALRLHQQEQGIAFLMNELAGRDRIIRQREEGIEWLQGVVRDKEITIAGLEEGVAWLRKEIEDRERLIRRLQAGQVHPDEVTATGSTGVDGPLGETAQHLSTDT